MAEAQSLSPQVWDQIYKAISSEQRAHPISQGVVTDRNEAKNQIWVSELSSDPIEVVGQAHEMTYFIGGQRKIARIPPAVPEIGDVVLVARTGGDNFKCVGILASTAKWQASSVAGLIAQDSITAREIAADAIGTSELAPGSVTEVEIASSVVLSVPIGSSVEYAGNTDPNPNWMIEDGRSLLRASYPALFTAIGVVFGSVDGTHFNIPDSRDKVAVGKSGTKALGSIGGAETHSITVAEMPSHGHAITDPGHTHQMHFHPNTNTAGTGFNIADVAATGFNSEGTVSSITGITVQSTGGGNAMSLMQPYIVKNKVIRVL